MILNWLDFPVALLFATLVAIYLLVALGLHWLTFHSPCRDWMQSFAGVAPPLLGAVAVLFVLLIGFLAHDVGERNKQAYHAVLTEREGLLALNTLSGAANVDRDAVTARIRAYVDAVVDDEWAKMTMQLHSVRAESALNSLLNEVAGSRVASAGSVMQAAMLNTVLRVRSARADRLTLANDRTNELKWLTLLILGAMTQTAIAVIHLDRRRAQLVALGMFTVAAIVALGLIAAQEQPFDGPIRVSPEPLRDVLKEISHAG